MTHKKDDPLHFRVDTPALLREIMVNDVMACLRVPINVFQNLLAQVADRATELNDPRLNVLMLELNLYEVPPTEIVAAIARQNRLVNRDNTTISNKPKHRKRPVLPI